MLGFELDFWDYATFATAALAGLAGVLTYIWIAGLPGRIALARHHPEARGNELRRPRVGLIDVEKEHRLASALDDEAVALPRVSVHRTDGQHATVLAQPVAGGREQHGRRRVRDGGVVAQ